MDSTVKNAESPQASLGRRSIAVLAAYGALLYFVALGSNRVLTLHEALFAQAAKEMVASGDWILTTYGGVYFNHKPPLTYWIMAALIAVFRSDNEWLLRIPFALAALGTAATMAFVVARRHGEWIGLLAGLIQLSTYYLLMQGRLAESDILLCLFVTTGVAAFAMARAPGMTPTTSGQGIAGRTLLAWSLAFHASAGLAFLTKGPIGLAFIGGGVGLWCLLRRDWGSLRVFFSPIPLAVSILLICVWPYLAWRADPTVFETWRYHNIGRFRGEMGGNKPPFFYLYTLPYMLLPWTPAVVIGLWAGFRRGLHRDGLWQLMGLTFLSGFAVLSAAVWQYKHYLVPVLPPLTLFGAYGLAATLEWLAVRGNPMRQDIGTPGLRQYRTAAWAFALVGAAATIVHVAAMPRFDSYRDQTEFARLVNQRLPANEMLYMVELPENQITFYLRQPLLRIDAPDQFLRKLAPDLAVRPIHVIGPEKLLRELGSEVRVEKLEACPTIRTIMRPDERICLFRIQSPELASRASSNRG